MWVALDVDSNECSNFSWYLCTLFKLRNNRNAHEIPKEK